MVGIGNYPRYRVRCRDCGAQGPLQDEAFDAVSDYNGAAEIHEKGIAMIRRELTTWLEPFRP